MDFADCLMRQLGDHPSAEAQDIVKFCFQAAFGAEHLLTDPSAAEKYFNDEYASVQSSDVPLSEIVSERCRRVNLAAWKREGLPADWLFNIFVLSAAETEKDEALFEAYLQTAEKLIRNGKTRVATGAWDAYFGAYRKNGMGAVHHSEAFRANEKPAYRIVSEELCALIPILQRIRVEEHRAFVIAIDGNAAAGKTTAAERLAGITGASVVHMDDFFLPAELRTKERYAEAGGNVHYERFAEEVLPFIHRREAFSYGRFDCGQLRIYGRREVAASSVRIVEGSYSCHPYFGDYADLRVFRTVGKDEQAARILRRNGAEMAERFKREWIPLEDRYFQTLDTNGYLILGDEGASSAGS